jgi:peptide/nickel transport system substrate-binding protein
MAGAVAAGTADGPTGAGQAEEQAARRSQAWARALTGRDARFRAGRARDGRARDGRSRAGRNDDRQHARGGVPGAYAPKGTAAPAGAGAAPLTKHGKQLTLRFVLPAGPGSEALRAVGDRISRMLERIGIRTEMKKVADDSYFNDHIASGQYDLALYSWPGSAFPATDGRPIFAKPVPGADGSLNVEQNYTRVGSDHIDQLFDKALTELNSGKEKDLVKKADARIWAEAGSIPLYQRPQLVAVRANLGNVGAFGFEDPRYEDIGFLRPGAQGPGPQLSGSAPAPGPQRSAGPGSNAGGERSEPAGPGRSAEEDHARQWEGGTPDGAGTTQNEGQGN